MDENMDKNVEIGELSLNFMIFIHLEFLSFFRRFILNIF